MFTLLRLLSAVRFASVGLLFAAGCGPAESGGAGGGTSTASSTGAGGAGGGEASEYGETLPNAEADDDDCKYHVKWTATDIYADTDVTFTAVITTAIDGKPLPTGEVDVEAFLNDTHPAPNRDAQGHRGAAGHVPDRPGALRQGGVVDAPVSTSTRTAPT